MTVSENQIKTFLFCKKLYHFNEDITSLEKSQALIFKTIKDLYLLIIKDKLKDFDKDLFFLIQKNLHSLYKEVNTLDDVQYLTNYTIQAVYKFFKLYPLKTFFPVVVNYQPEIAYKNNKLSIHYDILLRQNNKSGFLYGICFVQNIDEHFKANDVFIDFKLKYLKGLFTGRRSSHPATRMNFFSIKPASFRNKNQRGYKLNSYTKTEREISMDNLLSLEKLLDYFFLHQNLKIIMPICPNKSCIKRKECFNEN